MEHKCLTRREAEVAALVCRGLSTQMIGTLLVISPRTVGKHIENILEKLEVKNRVELITKLI